MDIKVEDASNYVCPMVRIIPKRGSNDEHLGIDGQDSCLGEECMAWRWSAKMHKANGELVRLGYCGMAGLPGEVVSY